MSGSEHVETDGRLGRSVLAAIRRSPTLRTLGADVVEVRADGMGVVTLLGRVSSDALRYGVAREASRVDGVLRVVNGITSDEMLERQVAQALAKAPGSDPRRVVVSVSRGIATLFGAVRTVDDGSAAVNIAKAVPGVLEVRNSLHVVPAGEPVILAWQDSVEGRADAARAIGKDEILAGPPPATTPSADPGEAPGGKGP